MPNHVTHNLIVTGPADDLTAFAELMTEGMDFQKVIPMPETLNIPAGSQTDEALMILRSLAGDKSALDGLRGTPRAGGATKDDEIIAALRNRTPVVKLGGWLDEGGATLPFDDFVLRVAENLIRYGETDWYEWSVKNWGTKWNAYATEKPERHDDRLVFTFQTAWSPPRPVMVALAARFPELSFDLAYFDEGWGFCGVNTYHADAVTDGMFTPEYGDERVLPLYYRCCGEYPEPEEAEK